MPGQEEIENYCDALNCLHPSEQRYWIKYQIVHTPYLTTEMYAHFCKEHYQMFPERVLTVQLPIGE